MNARLICEIDILDKHFLREKIMNQSSDNPSSDAVDCSEAMEREELVLKLADAMDRAPSHMLSHVPLTHREIEILTSLLADDADESSVQKTHPENQNEVPCVDCGVLTDYEDGICVACRL